MSGLSRDLPPSGTESGDIVVQAMVAVPGGLVTGNLNGAFPSANAAGRKNVFTISGSF